MAKYELRLKDSVRKDLRRIPQVDVRRILHVLEDLRDEPRPGVSVKLRGSERYRIRQGDYRIIYQILDADLVVYVVKVGHRRDNYERL